MEMMIPKFIEVMGHMGLNSLWAKTMQLCWKKQIFRNSPHSNDDKPINHHFIFSGKNYISFGMNRDGFVSRWRDRLFHQQKRIAAGENGLRQGERQLKNAGVFGGCAADATKNQNHWGGGIHRAARNHSLRLSRPHSHPLLKLTQQNWLFFA